VVHNRPSDDPTPSQADIQMTGAIVDTAQPLGISVHDHIIVGKNGHASLKGLKLYLDRRRKRFAPLINGLWLRFESGRIGCKHAGGDFH
jgi:hypothetical protein